MIPALSLLLACQLLGEGLARIVGLPVPGPVIGLVVLAVGLLAGRRIGRVRAGSLAETPLGRVSDGLLRNLSLLFVPAGVGIVQQGAILLGNGPAIIAALIGSTIATLVVSVLVFVAVMRLTGTVPGPDRPTGETVR